MLAMVRNPDIQRKAQAEIDDVVGRDRLPTFADYEDLPYIRALVREVLRWNPVDPLGACFSVSPRPLLLIADSEFCHRYAASVYPR